MFFSVLILNKVAMAGYNVEYTVDNIYLERYDPSVFDSTLNTPPDYGVLTPFAYNRGY